MLDNRLSGTEYFLLFTPAAGSLRYWLRPSDTVLLLLSSLGRDFVPKRVKRSIYEFRISLVLPFITI